MHKNEDSTTAIIELRNTGRISILDTEQEIKEHDRIELKSDTKQAYIEMLKKNYYSEFVTGVLIGFQLYQESEKNKKKTSWIPELFKK